jgi:hypothetical protein
VVQQGKQASQKEAIRTLQSQGSPCPQCPIPWNKLSPPCPSPGSQWPRPKKTAGPRGQAIRQACTKMLFLSPVSGAW